MNPVQAVARSRLVTVGLLLLFVFLLMFNAYLYGVTETTSTARQEEEPSVSVEITPDYNHTEETVRLNTAQVEQDNPDLVRMIKHDFLHNPSVLPYNIVDNKRQDYSQGGQSKFLDTLLNQKTNGFFVECGALDGERLSNSLFFEKYRNWRGILIEPHPGSYQILRSKNRKAFSVNSCLSTNKYPAQIPMALDMVPDLSRFNNSKTDHSIRRMNKVVKVTHIQCFPLYSILLACGRTGIDLFSLDIEGAELDVLKTIPWTKVDIQVLLVESSKGGKKTLIDFMASKGYTSLPNKDTWNQDIVFVKNGFEYNKAGLN